MLVYFKEFVLLTRIEAENALDRGTLGETGKGAGKVRSI